MSGSLRLGAAMLCAIALVTVAMFYDEQREFELALAALQSEQSALATAVAADFEARLNHSEEGAEVPHDAAGLRKLVARLIGGAHKLEQPHSRLVLVDDPQTPSFMTAGGERVVSEALRSAVSRGATEVTLNREQALRIGLPRRLAVVAIRTIDDESGRWRVIIVASADRLRAREHRAQWRLALGVGIITLLVGGFGGLALRHQRRQLAAARELELAALQSERERLLAKTDKMTTLAALSSGIAHQVATPLGIIVARIEQVLPSVAHDERAQAALGVVSEQVSRIQQVIRGVLSLARGNRMALIEAEPLGVVRGALRSVDHRLQQAGVRLEVTEAPAPAPRVRCDPPLLEQALVNLMLNACEASRRGDVIQVHLEHSAGQLSFVIDDAGEGIREEIANGTREPFFTTKPQGAGLGLVIASEIAAHHGGRLTLSRRAEGGTRAVVTIPLG